jgi:hypothetical protein
VFFFPSGVFLLCISSSSQERLFSPPGLNSDFESIVTAPQGIMWGNQTLSCKLYTNQKNNKEMPSAKKPLGLYMTNVLFSKGVRKIIKGSEIKTFSSNRYIAVFKPECGDIPGTAHV